MNEVYRIPLMLSVSMCCFIIPSNAYHRFLFILDIIFTSGCTEVSETKNFSQAGLVVSPNRQTIWLSTLASLTLGGS